MSIKCIAVELFFSFDICNDEIRPKLQFIVLIKEASLLVACNHAKIVNDASLCRERAEFY